MCSVSKSDLLNICTCTDIASAIDLYEPHRQICSVDASFMQIIQATAIIQQSYSNHTAIIHQSYSNHTKIIQQSYSNHTTIIQQSYSNHTTFNDFEFLLRNLLRQSILPLRRSDLDDWRVKVNNNNNK